MFLVNKDPSRVDLPFPFLYLGFQVLNFILKYSLSHSIKVRHSTFNFFNSSSFFSIKSFSFFLLFCAYLLFFNNRLLFLRISASSSVKPFKFYIFIRCFLFFCCFLVQLSARVILIHAGSFWAILINFVPFKDIYVLF